MSEDAFVRWKQEVERIFRTEGVERALSFVQSALLVEDDWRMRVEEAGLLTDALQFDEAARVLHALLEERPDECEPHYHLGVALLNGSSLPRTGIPGRPSRSRRRAWGIATTP